MTPSSDIVLVTVDSLRADHCSFAGYHRETTPAIDKLAASGTVFENAVSPGPSTPESMPVVFTGDQLQPGGEDGDVSTMRDAIGRHLAIRDTIPERLSRRGYATAGFTPNPFTSRFFGFDAGFDHFQDFMGSAVRRRYGRTVEQFVGGTAAGPVVRLIVNLVFRQEAFKPWAAYYDQILEWIQEADRPYFLWVHLMDPHIPYLPPREYRTQPWWAVYHANYRFWREDKESAFDLDHRERLVRTYDDTIQYTDAFVDRLATDLGDETTFLIHGDHGEAFGEHGTYGHEPHLYEENIHVPLVVSNYDDDPVRHPVSLACLPRLIERVAAGESIDSRGDAFAVSRTHRGGRTALRGETVKYLDDGSEEQLFDLRDGEQEGLGNEELLEICRNRRQMVERTERESQLIRAAAEEVP